MTSQSQASRGPISPMSSRILNGSVYTGYTANPDVRLREHNKSRKSRGGGRQFYYVFTFGEFDNKTQASRFENLIKSARGKGAEPKLAKVRSEMASDRFARFARTSDGPLVLRLSNPGPSPI